LIASSKRIRRKPSDLPDRRGTRGAFLPPPIPGVDAETSRLLANWWWPRAAPSPRGASLARSALDRSAKEPYTTVEVLESLEDLSFHGECVVVQRYGERNVELEKALRAKGAEVGKYHLPWALPENPHARGLIDALDRARFDARFTQCVAGAQLFALAEKLGRDGPLAANLTGRSSPPRPGMQCRAARHAVETAERRPITKRAAQRGTAYRRGGDERPVQVGGERAVSAEFFRRAANSCAPCDALVNTCARPRRDRALDQAREACGVLRSASGRWVISHDFRAPSPAGAFPAPPVLSAVTLDQRRIRPWNDRSSSDSRPRRRVGLFRQRSMRTSRERSAAVGLGRRGHHAVRQQARSFGVNPRESAAAKSALRATPVWKIAAFGGCASARRSTLAIPA